MIIDVFKQISSDTDIRHVGRARQHSAKTAFLRDARNDRLRRNKRNYLLLGMVGILFGTAVAYAIDFTIVSVAIGAFAGLIIGLTLGLLFER